MDKQVKGIVLVTALVGLFVVVVKKRRAKKKRSFGEKAADVASSLGSEFAEFLRAKADSVESAAGDGLSVASDTVRRTTRASKKNAKKGAKVARKAAADSLETVADKVAP